MLRLMFDVVLGVFVCHKTHCICVVNRRGLNPPHRVKSISMASFSADEMEFIKCRGNDVRISICIVMWDYLQHVYSTTKVFIVTHYV